jgi:hypothetical protein
MKKNKCFRGIFLKTAIILRLNEFFVLKNKANLISVLQNKNKI